MVYQLIVRESSGLSVLLQQETNLSFSIQRSPKRYRTMMETLNELAQLRDSGFGQPWPRHGLKLLYWFANDCFSFKRKNSMLCKCDPANGEFGFHLFENRYDEYGDKLLPDIDFPYYVVGNLNSPGAEELPDYVSEDNSPDLHNSNTDRIIVSLYDEEWFHRVYVTQHHNRSNYDQNATYRISRGLLMIIRRRSLEYFLEEMDYSYLQLLLSMAMINYSPQTTDTVSPDFTVLTPPCSDSDDSEPPETQRNYTKTQIDDKKKTCYLPTPVINYRPQNTNKVTPDFTAITSSSSDSDDNEYPAAIQLDDNEKTGYYKYTQPLLPTPVINYRLQVTSTVSPDFTAVTPSSSDSAHNKRPAAQRNYTKIQLHVHENTGFYSYKQPFLPTPVVSYSPQTTRTISQDFTAITPSSSDSDEPPETQGSDSIIQFDDDMSTQDPSENLKKKKGLCKRFCTIL
ncbi:uncharacterized protein LOC125271132 isoform X2 [Megalobrama amblycephala]|uniref:uncharacterized protein LOC125271132 isoform X2 n=1 Tax=Megalobrama amblycephala TaxID=75352 RepID=UPI00201450FC|nr:uncharacterized protein LOC125271132 isoform X2 [Megalobrama amblycephala]XP_048051075.1 uncharacterized protein LOC125271132 isoform X2 [Megalobrama amblycephala]